MKNNFSSEELIEEQFLKLAGARHICTWLSEHADRDVIKTTDPFHFLRATYEPIWAHSKNELVKFSVCRYGRNLKTLRKLLLKDGVPQSHKEAILKNNALMRDGGIYDSVEDLYLSPADIIRIYRAGTSQRSMFFRLFFNGGIEDEFLESVFKRKPPFNVISDRDRLTILQILFNDHRRFFSERSTKYGNYYAQQRARALANAIVSFIATSREFATDDGMIKHAPFSTTLSVRRFIEESQNLSSEGMLDLDRLFRFYSADTGYESEREGISENISYIRFHLSNRAFSRVVLSSEREAIAKLLESTEGEIRSVYYRNAPLDMIYSTTERELDHFFSQPNAIALDDVFDQNSLAALATNAEGNPILEAIRTHLSRDGVGFTVSLALNKNHYISRHRRAFLSALCRCGDRLGNAFPLPFGNGSSFELFEQQCEELQQSNPEFFKDESMDTRILEKIEAIQSEVERLKELVTTGANTLKK